MSGVSKRPRLARFTRKPSPRSDCANSPITAPITDRVTPILSPPITTGSAAGTFRYYAEATIAVVPSVYEGFGLPAGEAMACGVPVISTDGGALPEVVGDAGVVVPAKSVDGLAQAIDDLLSNPERRQQLGRAGKQRIDETFCWNVCAREMTDYYRQVLAADLEGDD